MPSSQRLLAHRKDTQPVATMITLTELRKIRSDRSFTLPALPKSYGSHPTNAQIQLLIRQWYLGLPVQPLLDADPVLERSLNDLKEALPSAFKPGKRFRLHTSLTAPLMVGQKQIVIQVEVNLGFRQGVPRLYEWGMRKPSLNWRDRIKLWVATEYFRIQPEKLKLVVVALHRTRATQKIVHSWNKQLHRRTARSLIALLTDQTPLNLKSSAPSCTQEVLPIDLSEVREVPI